MACQNCKKIRDAVLHGRMAEALDITVEGLRVMIGIDAGADHRTEVNEPGVLDQSIPDLTAHLETVTDAETLDALLSAEIAGKSRAGAIAAIEARRDALA